MPSETDNLSRTIQERESALLAPYGFPSRQTAGRRHPEPDHPYRAPFQRDRDRILHSAAFRRLSGKMQVFTGEMGDYHRTRLTHTMEVTSIARTIGRALKLNEDLIEALALLHDIGHPPFGHAGEDVLDECLSDAGGFSHNQFALTLVEELEARYAAFPGLNLSEEVLDGQRDRIDKSGNPQAPLLEAQVVDAADSIAYNAHDVDDAIKLGLVSFRELGDAPLAGAAAERVQQRHPDLPQYLVRQVLVHELVDTQVSSVVQHSLAFLSRCDWQDPRQAHASDFRIEPQPDVGEQKKGLEAYLYERVYRHDNLLRVRRVAQHQLREMMEYFSHRPDELPESFQRRREVVGTRRAAAEYLAGMTDRFCRSEYQRLIAPA